MDQRIVTFGLSVLFVLMWSSGFIGAAYGLGYAGTFTLLFWRYVVVAGVLVAAATILARRCRLSAGQLAHHAVIGVLAHAVWLACVLAALDRGVSPGIAAFVTALQPMVTAVLAGPALGEPVSPRQWVGLALGLGSVALVVSDKVALGGSLAAHLLPFVAVLGISIASVIDRRGRTSGLQAGDPPIVVTTSIHAVASLAVLAPLAGAVEGFAAGPGWPLVFAIGWLAVVVSLGAYGLMFVLLRRLEATHVASLMYLSPPPTMALAWLTFGDRLGVAEVGGLVIAGVAVIMVNLPRERLRAALALQH